MNRHGQRQRRIIYLKDRKRDKYRERENEHRQMVRLMDNKIIQIGYIYFIVYLYAFINIYIIYMHIILKIINQ